MIAGGAGNLFARRFRADASRAEVRLPTPTSRAATPAAVDLPVPGLGPFFAPNARFYRVDTALLVPAVMAEDWRLRVHGMVDREISVDFEQLLARPMIERDITIACVSNPVGGRYVGNARWIGAPLKDLLEEAGVRPGADQDRDAIRRRVHARHTHRTGDGRQGRDAGGRDERGATGHGAFQRGADGFGTA